MKLGLSLFGIVAALVVGTYYSLFYNPQNAQQQQMNQVWSQFAQEIKALGGLVENAPFNRDERTAAEGYRHLARLRHRCRVHRGAVLLSPIWAPVPQAAVACDRLA